MKARIGLVKTCLLSALLSSTALVSTGALAQTAGTGSAPADQTFAPWIVDTSNWWFHGTVEAGGRDFTNDPQKSGIKAVRNGKSLSGYYEYNDIKPGAFGNFDLSTGSKDGLYRVDAGGRNVGYEDQSYYFDWSKAGEQYFNFYWDQSPHLYSMNALSPFVVNGNVVTLRPGIPTAGVTTPATLAPYAVPVDLGIHRDTAAANYRWTPGGDWDFNLDYSHMSRTGTQPSAVGEANVVLASPTQMMKPVNDSTQNYGADGEHVGTSPWGQRYVFSMGYSGSQYQDGLNNYFVQGNYPNAAARFATVSTWPSNQANAFSSTLSADLPWQSRYIGTLSYTMMTQNATFPVTNSTGAAPYTPSGQPSLDGGINTLLFNNVVTTKISPDLTAKTTYRYYDYKNNTPELGVDLAASLPFGGGAALDVATSGLNGTVTGHAISMGYIKTNAGEALDWRPNKYWNLGASYGFERYDWTRADVNVTNENSGKVFADYKPFGWLTSRASAEFSSRRYQNYDYYGNVGDFQWISVTPPAAGFSGDLYSNTQRQLMIDNRQVWKANYSLDVVAFRNFTITPWTKYQDANYSVDPYTQQGLQDNKSWNFGVDGTYVISHDLSVMAGYSRMYGTQVMYSNSNDGAANGGAVTCLSGAGPYAAACQNITNERNVVNTFVAAVKYAAIPDKLDLDLRYTASHGVDDLGFLPAGVVSASTPGLYAGTTQFPENKVWFQRLDATAIYKFDQTQVAALGWKGDVKAKLNYAWERNSESNWANDPLAPTSTAYLNQIYMGWYNPNYNVQIVSASLIASW